MNICHIKEPEISDYEKEIETIAKQINNQEISDINEFSDEMKKDLKHYFYRYHRLNDYEIYKYFFNPPEEGKILKTFNHQYIGHEHLNNSIFSKPFFYFVLNDPRIHNEESIEKLKIFVNEMNRIVPLFIIIIGSFVECKVGEDDYEKDMKKFHEILYKLNSKINILLVGSENEFGDCSNEELSRYKILNGDNYYQYWTFGLNIYILNSTLIRSKNKNEEEKENQLNWFEEEMFISKIGSTHLLILVKDDLFVKNNTELIGEEDKENYLKIIKRSGVEMIISGDTNSGRVEEDLIEYDSKDDDGNVTGTELINESSFFENGSLSYVIAEEEKMTMHNVVLTDLNELEIDLLNEEGENGLNTIEEGYDDEI